MYTMWRVQASRGSSTEKKHWVVWCMCNYSGLYHTCSNDTGIYTKKLCFLTLVNWLEVYWRTYMHFLVKLPANLLDVNKTKQLKHSGIIEGPPFGSPSLNNLLILSIYLHIHSSNHPSTPLPSFPKQGCRELVCVACMTGWKAESPGHQFITGPDKDKQDKTTIHTHTPNKNIVTVPPSLFGSGVSVVPISNIHCTRGVMYPGYVSSSLQAP